MRFWLICILCMSGWPTLSFSQTVLHPSAGTIPRRSLPRPSFGGGYHGNHGHAHCYGPQPAPGFGYGGGYNPGFGYTFTNQSPFGLNYSGYSSVTYGAPGFSVGYSTPLFGNSYYGPVGGYPMWNAPIYAAPPVYLNPQPVLPALPQWMIDEARLANRPVEKVKPISRTHQSLLPPSSPEAQLRSVRMQDTGDRLFATLDYSAAEKSYIKSVQAAPDRPDPYVRLAVAKASRGDFRGAVSSLRLMADIDSTYPGRADSLDRLFGDRNGISKLQLKQRVADWTKVDIRDPDRIYLLGIMLFLDGDERFRTLLDTAVKLEGDKPHLTAFLRASPAQGNSAPAPTPDEIDALAAPQPNLAQPPEPGNLPLLLPTLPEPPAP